jgi:flagellar biosynthesis GTPase FlhF
MPHETLTGSNIPELFARAQERLGPEAVLLSVRRIAAPEGTLFEVLAADPESARRHAQQTARVVAAAEGAGRSRVPEEATAPQWEPRSGEREDPAIAFSAPQPENVGAMRKLSHGPRVIALVGPTGSGKTTTIAKLANHWAAFGDRRVGVICLDTYRVGGIEQAQIYAELSRLPLEVVFEEKEIPHALRRLRDCEVILVDTPGRGPKAFADTAATGAQLAGLRPDEVHLTLPAGLQEKLARRVIAEHRAYGVTHLLPTKLDEFPDDRTAFELARQYRLPMRWAADGQEVPRDLRAATVDPPRPRPDGFAKARGGSSGGVASSDPAGALAAGVA